MNTRSSLPLPNKPMAMSSVKYPYERHGGATMVDAVQSQNQNRIYACAENRSQVTPSWSSRPLEDDRQRRSEQWPNQSRYLMTPPSSPIAADYDRKRLPEQWLNQGPSLMTHHRIPSPASSCSSTSSASRTKSVRQPSKNADRDCYYPIPKQRLDTRDLREPYFLNNSVSSRDEPHDSQADMPYPKHLLCAPCTFYTPLPPP